MASRPVAARGRSGEWVPVAADSGRRVRVVDGVGYKRMDGEVTDVERDLAKDLELCEAATKGPWRVIGEHFMERPLREHMHLGGIGTDSIYVCAWGIEGPCGDSKGIVPDDADLAFIAESREGWPEAIRRAMAAEAEVERLKKAVEFYADVENWVSHNCVDADGYEYKRPSVIYKNADLPGREGFPWCCGAVARAALKGGDPS